MSLNIVLNWRDHMTKMINLYFYLKFNKTEESEQIKSFSYGRITTKFEGIYINGPKKECLVSLLG